MSTLCISDLWRYSSLESSFLLVAVPRLTPNKVPHVSARYFYLLCTALGVAVFSALREFPTVIIPVLPGGASCFAVKFSLARFFLLKSKLKVIDASSNLKYSADIYPFFCLKWNWKPERAFLLAPLGRFFSFLCCMMTNVSEEIWGNISIILRSKHILDLDLFARVSVTPPVIIWTYFYISPRKIDSFINHVPHLNSPQLHYQMLWRVICSKEDMIYYDAIILEKL